MDALKEFLDEKAALYNQPKFITSDPIQIPHAYSIKQDIEISGFLTATIAWGNRTSIIKSAHKMMQLMENSPYDFVMHHQKQDLQPLSSFVHRTFNSNDLICFIQNLKNLYLRFSSMEDVFLANVTSESLQPSIHAFKQVFFNTDVAVRSQKHVSDPLKGSAAKRINMFLRWMVRQDQRGVDLGIWNRLNAAQLSCPLDVHSGNVARKLGLLTRKQNDAKAVYELDSSLRKLDASDPVKYDFALFGLGVFEKF
ncbi:MAG: TIGR02757 family protein [Flavobacteriaceae bacterium]|nr:TIGR02757 family protein [Flavobacteriaceae bacterium]